MYVFHKVGKPDEKAVYNVTRTDDGSYALLEQFEYTEPWHKERTFTVPANLAAFDTDFASVPVFATWLVPRDGTHTPAAILHDALLRNAQAGDAIDDGIDADTVFRDAMGHLDVALLRRWLMWTAVSLRTLAKEGGRASRLRFKVAIAVTVVTCLGMTLLTFVDMIRGSGEWRPNWLDNVVTDYLWVGAVVSPLLWSPHIGLGVIAAVALVVFGIPLVAALIGLVLYSIAEWLAYVGLAAAKAWNRIPWTPPGPLVKPKVMRRRT